MEEKTYTLPIDIAKKFDEATGYENIIKVIAPIPLTYKKIKNLSKEVRNLRNIAWQEIYSLYPELEGKELQADSDKLTIKVLCPPT